MSSNAYPNGRCSGCGFGLAENNKDESCANPDCIYKLSQEQINQLIQNKKAWFVVVERWNMQQLEIPSYVVGPYSTESDAETAADSEIGVVYSLLTIDAKNEGYVATECFWTQEPPANGSFIIPPAHQDEQAELEED